MLLCAVNHLKPQKMQISQPSGYWGSRVREGMDCNRLQDTLGGLVDNDLHHSDVSMAIPGPKLKACALNMCDLLHVNQTAIKT